MEMLKHPVKMQLYDFLSHFGEFLLILREHRFTFHACQKSKYPLTHVPILIAPLKVVPNVEAPPLTYAPSVHYC
jgi:hypothetical protein